MIPLLLIVIAIISYILGSLSTPLLMAKYIFHKDITPRRGIVGYNTFARHFGTKWALLMVVADIVKCAAAVFIGGLLLSIPGEGFPVIGRLFACFCLVLGDIFPAQRHYRGGKGVICLFTALWVADWRVGLFVTGVFIAVLALSQFMSLASLAGCLTGILACSHPRRCHRRSCDAPWSSSPPCSLSGATGGTSRSSCSTKRKR